MLRLRYPNTPERQASRGSRHLRKPWGAAHKKVSLLLLLIVTASPLGSPATPASASSSVAPSVGALLGMYAKASGTTVSAQQGAVTWMESQLGRSLDIDHFYYGWGTQFPDWREKWNLSAGRTPMISWSGTASSNITSGGQDALIRARADALKALGKPVLLRYFPDMDLDAHATLTGGATKYIEAWRRMHGIFASRGATNVEFVWCPTGYGFQTGEAQTYYPGASYVDWVCADSYNWAPSRPGAQWTSFSSLFSAFYQWGVTTGKPLMVGETGVQERNTGEKAQWFTDAAAAMKSSFPQIKAFVYFNSESSTADWWVNSTTSSFNAYKALAADRHFNTRTAVVGSLLGAYVQPEGGWSQSHWQAGITKLETDMGRKLNIDHSFYGWSDTFPTWKESWDITNGRIPLISWTGTTSSSITSGSHDALIRARARGIKGLTKPVLIRFFPEMDDSYHDVRTQSPSAFIAAWQRVVTLFKSEGATNALWVFCGTSYGFKIGKAQTYYPGDAWVDWTCADGFNWAPTRQNAVWTSFRDIFSSFYTWASARPKPIMVGETGALERHSGEKGQWITDMRNTLKNTFPSIRALVYFDSLSSSFQGGSYDWRVDTSTSSYNAFKSMAADPYFKPVPSTIVAGY